MFDVQPSQLLHTSVDDASHSILVSINCIELQLTLSFYSEGVIVTMEATGLSKVVIEKLQAKVGPLSQCSKAIRTVISDSEIAVDYLERIVDYIDHYNDVQFERAVGCSIQLAGSVAAVCGVKGLLQYGLSEFETFPSVVGVTLGACLVVFGTGILRQINAKVDIEVNGHVKNNVVPLMEKLQSSISELQMRWSSVSGVCAVLCANTGNQTTWLNSLNSLEISPTIITTIKSSANIFSSVYGFLRNKKHPTIERIVKQLLPWLQQQIKELKIAEQQINKIRANISDVVTADDSTE